MKLGIATLALGSILVATGASALPVAPGTHIGSALELSGAAIERVHDRSPLELSRDSYRRDLPYGVYEGHPSHYGADRWHRDGVGVYRQPPGANYTRRNFPYAYGDTFGFWPDQEPN